DAGAVPVHEEALEDLVRAIGVRIEQPCDAPFERVEDAGAWGWAGPLETRSCQPLGDGLSVNAECARNLSDGQALTIPAVADPGERLVVDHDRLRGQSGGVRGPCALAPMSLPRRNKRSGGLAMSARFAVPTR